MKMPRFCAIFLFALALWGADADPFVGVWKLDADKSVFPKGGPSFLTGTIGVEADGNTLKSQALTATEQGFANNVSFNCSLDGKPCKPTTSLPMRGSSTVDTITLKRVDPHTITATGTKSGKLVYSDRRVVSADGKTLTVNRHGVAPNGTEYESVIVLIRSSN
jgi:hypothetical protein